MHNVLQSDLTAQELPQKAQEVQLVGVNSKEIICGLALHKAAYVAQSSIKEAARVKSVS